MSNIDKNLVIEKLIWQLPNKYCDDFMEWLSIGHFIFNELGNDGFTLFDKWSQQSNKYHPEGCKKIYYCIYLYLDNKEIYKYNIDILNNILSEHKNNFIA